MSYKLKIKSDFIDVYDHWFDLEADVTFSRMSIFGPDKKEQFQILKSMGYKVPLHGEARWVMRMHWDAEGYIPNRFVVYENPYLHRGEGKRLAHRAHLYTSREFCCAYVCSEHKILIPSQSKRVLQLGQHRFELMYTSNVDWRSNVGDGDIELLDGKLNYGFSGSYPIYAVDLVKSESGAWYAIDFNTSPGIKGCNIERYLSSKDIVESIKEWYERFSRPTI